MEVITAPRCQSVNLRAQLANTASNSCRKVPISLPGLKFGTGFSRGLKKVNSKAFRKSDGYVIGDDELGTIAATESSGLSSIGGKVFIPGLPDESSSASVSSGFWEWKPKLNVHYEKAGCENLESPQVLFLPGFGVGSFHYEKQLKDMGRQYRVWAVDFLGQGLSLPGVNPTEVGEEGLKDGAMWGFGDEAQPWASELVYSVDLWRDQVRYFVEEVIGEPVYIVGNSLGGYIALYFAAAHPELVKGVTLLNATPFWGFLPNPIKSPALARVFTWSGTFPLPARVKKIMQFLWQKISDPRSIAEVLKQVYADHSTDVDKVFSRIVEITEHPAAAASFTSIMFAPRGELSFSEALSRCKASEISICLVYGKEDPWVNPTWGHLAKREVPQAPYYELSPAGHCPHDEVPEVVNYILRGWIKNLESNGSFDLPLLDYGQSVETDAAKSFEFARGGSKKSVDVRLIGSGLSFWEQMRFNLSSQLGKLKPAS